jgi:predicted peptidase
MMSALPIDSKIQKKQHRQQQNLSLGLSMGSLGAWNLVVAHPETFAASLVPIAGYVDRIQ